MHIENTEYLFVYGTLMKSTGSTMSKFLCNNAYFIGKGFTHGVLYLVHFYPGAVFFHHQMHWVYGEIYKLKNINKVLTRLDKFEDFDPKNLKSNVYNRVIIDVKSEIDVFKCWAYNYNLPTKNLMQIESGDFNEYLRQKTAI